MDKRSACLRTSQSSFAVLGLGCSASVLVQSLGDSTIGNRMPYRDPLSTLMSLDYWSQVLDRSVRELSKNLSSTSGGLLEALAANEVNLFIGILALMQGKATITPLDPYSPAE